MAKEKKRGLAAVKKIAIRDIDPPAPTFTTKSPSGRALPQMMQTLGLLASQKQTSGLLRFKTAARLRRSVAQGIVSEPAIWGKRRFDGTDGRATIFEAETYGFFRHSKAAIRWKALANGPLTSRAIVTLTQGASRSRAA